VTLSSCTHRRQRLRTGHRYGSRVNLSILLFRVKTG
jgi:hypothetical protein